MPAIPKWLRSMFPQRVQQSQMLLGQPRSRYASAPHETAARVRKMDGYVSRHVQTASDFLCQHYQACRDSHCGDFYEGQLHHIGEHYDLAINDHPYRLMVVGQETGRDDRLVTLLARRALVRKIGYEWRFKADGKHTPRNPHMKGTTSLLRLLHGLPFGSDHASEFLRLASGERIHLYDAFSLVNYLLCTATTGSTQGRSTSVMRRNCRRHFRAALEILEPTVVVVQGKSFWPAVRKAFDDLKPLDEHLFRGRINSSNVWVASFSHPSAQGDKRWGGAEPTAYLRNVVQPTVEKIRRLALGTAG